MAKGKHQGEFTKCAFLLLLVVSTFATAQDEGPILKPKPKPPPPASATLLVTCDLACNWKLDGEAKGSIDAGGSKKVSVSLGQHLVDATTQDGLDKIEQQIDVKSAEQTVVRIQLQPVQDARLKAEQETREKTAREQAQKEQAAKSRAPLLVACDLDCDWKLDGEAKGSVDAGGSQRVSVVLGQHLVNVTTKDGLDKVEKQINIKSTEQTVMRIQLQPVRDARLIGYALDLYEQKRYTEAKPLLEQACNRGDMQSCVFAGRIYENGDGAGKDYAQALPLYEKACDGGNTSGCNSLGILYLHGSGVAKDYTKAQSLFEKSCNEKGDVAGCNNLGVIYQYGLGVKRDIQKARTFFELACKGDVQVACDSLHKLP
jgi:hypothetical protein